MSPLLIIPSQYVTISLFFNIDNPKSMCSCGIPPAQGLFLTARGLLSVCRTATSRLVNNLAMNAGSAVTTATTTLQSYVTFLNNV
jgi:hypothetical protein